MVRITLKGKAILAATKVGLCPHTEDGYDIGKFLKFWDAIEPEIRRKEKELAQERWLHHRWYRNFLVSMIAGTFLLALLFAAMVELMA